MMESSISTNYSVPEWRSPNSKVRLSMFLFQDPTVVDPSSILSLLEAATMYWQFPVIPGMSLYPRITSELKNIDRVPLAPLALKTMSNQWVECCEQLFMSYKKGERESFYVASAVFNVFFTKTAVSDDVDLSEESQSCFRSFKGQCLVALVSHTSSSTREHLRNQGSFTCDHNLFFIRFQESTMR